MVKVLPNTFQLFEGHKIINPSAEPLCIHCSDGLVFAACDGCIVEVYALPEVKLIAKLRTILPVIALVYSPVGDCILTLERRGPDQPGAARIYSKWRGILDKDKPQRVMMSLPVGGFLSGLMSSPTAAEPTRPDAEIVELPVENASCIASCNLAPVVAVGSGKIIRLFILERNKEEGAEDTQSSLNVTFFVDICTDMKLKKIAVCGNFVACISTHRVRVVKCMFLTPFYHPWSNLYPQASSNERRQSSCNLPKCPLDRSYTKWSPSLVWEEESRAMSGLISEKESEKIAGLERRESNEEGKQTGAKEDQEEEDETDKEDDELAEMNESIDQTTPRATPTFSFSFPGQVQQTVGTLNIPLISNAITEAKRDIGRQPVEVLGPVEYVWGQPLTVELHKSAGKCRVLTMLFRRFPTSGYAYVPVDNRGRSATLGANAHLTDRRTSSLVTGGIGKAGGKGGLHSVELVPTMTEGEGCHQKLIGVSCLVSNKMQGFLYDVYQKTRLVSSLQFMSRCQTLSFDGCFLHTLSSESVDSYTTRVFASAMSGFPFLAGGKDKWLSQPCPPSNMEVSLVSTNKFIGSSSIASSSSHIAVMCKQWEESGSAGRASLFQSLSFRKPVKQNGASNWNIYIVEKKHMSTVFRELMESAESHADCSPPVLQQYFCEAHLLLRANVIAGSQDSDTVSLLQTNCFKLASSLCTYSRDSSARVAAAGYFVLSGRSISEVVKHIITKHPDESIKEPYEILMMYLGMVLFNKEYSHTQHGKLQAKQILQLYFKHDPSKLPEVILYSWLKSYSKDKALKLLGLLLPTSVDKRGKDSLYETTLLATVVLHTQLGRPDVAMKGLSSLSESHLLSWSKTHPSFLVDYDQGSLTPLGRIVLEGLSSCFLSFVTHLLEEDQLSFDTLCSALCVEDESVLLTSHVLKKLLENIVDGQFIPADSTIPHKAALLLIRVLYARVHSDAAGTKVDSFVNFGRRYLWLNQLPPYESSMDDSTSSQYSDKARDSLRDLMELQSLLCSKHMNRAMAVLVDQLTTTKHSNDGCGIDFSLKLMSWPFMEKLSQATELILDRFSQIAVEYCQTFYKLELVWWRQLLDDLLHRISTPGEATTAAELPVLCSVYKDALLHVATITSPEELFQLLPPSGDIKFFLPVIERSCKLYMAKQISGHLHANLTNY